MASNNGKRLNGPNFIKLNELDLIESENLNMIKFNQLLLSI